MDVVVRVNMPLLLLIAAVSPKWKPPKDCNAMLVVAPLAVFFCFGEMLSPVELITVTAAGTAPIDVRLEVEAEASFPRACFLVRTSFFGQIVEDFTVLKRFSRRLFMKNAH